MHIVTHKAYAVDMAYISKKRKGKKESKHLLYKIGHKSALRNNDLRFQCHSYLQKQDVGSQLSEPA